MNEFDYYSMEHPSVASTSEQSNSKGNSSLLQQRLSTQFIFKYHSEFSQGYSEETLRKVDNLIAQFPLPANHQPPTAAQTKVTNVSDATIKSLANGLAGLKRGIFQGWG
jgi:uncharacterized protein YccT (UPF0319 family)